MPRILATVVALALCGAAAAQTYPSRAIRVIIPQTPGSGVDLIVRKSAEELLPRLGQPMVIENNPAGNSVPAADNCARSAPDGHTLCVLNNDAMAINPYLFSKLPYDPEKDFKPVVNLYYILGGLLTKAALPPGTVKEFIEYAQAKPGSINFATLGPNTSTDLSRRWLGDFWKADFQGIPYKGGPQVFTALASGEADATWMGVYGALSLLRAGKVKLLAINGSKRLAAWPDVPTLKELGADNMPSAQSWWGVIAPAGTPDPIVRRINGEFVKLYHEPKFGAFLDSLVTEPATNTPEEFAALIRDRRAFFGKLLADYKIPRQ